ncbi:MAG: hypothetical protein WCG47_08365, partial [Dermatophilaceae bacterium]
MARPDGEDIPRRAVLLGALGLAAGGALAACTGSASDGHAGDGMPSGSLPSPVPASAAPGQRVVEVSLTPKPVTLDLGGPTVNTWAFGDTT